MLSYNELKEKTLFIKDNEPYEVLEYSFVRMQQTKPVAQLKIRNLITGKTVNYTAHQNEKFEEAEIEKMPVKFLYRHRNQFWFCEAANPKNRFALNEDIVGNNANYLKPGLEIKALKSVNGFGRSRQKRDLALKFKEKIINIELPIKIEFKVTEAPPGIKGNTSQGGTKSIVLETGAKINVPLFIGEGDIVRINTATGEYVERVQKSQAP